MKNKLIYFLIIILVLTLCLKLFSMSYLPIGEDESFYGYRADKILQGRTLHEEGLYSSHSSLTIYLLSGFFYLFGSNLATIRLAGFLVDLVLIILMFFIGKELFGTKYGLMASSFYAIVSLLLDSSRYGAEPLCSIFGLLAVFLYLKHKESSGFIVGILIGFSTWFKQTGILFFIAILIHQIWFNGKGWLKKILVIVLGMLLVSLPLSLYFYFNSGFNFIFDLIINVARYSTENSRALVIGKLFRMLLMFFGFLFIIILGKRKENKDRLFYFLWIYIIINILFFIINRELPNEHLIQLAPFLILLSLSYLKEYPKESWKLIKILIIISLLTIFMISLENEFRGARENQREKQEGVLGYITDNIPLNSSVYSVSEKYIYMGKYDHTYRWTSLTPFVKSVESFDDFCDFIEGIDYIILTSHQERYLGDKNKCIYNKFVLMRKFENIAESDVKIMERKNE